jgi:formylglycine-generating enzyme required for sulfatase activity
LAYDGRFDPAKGNTYETRLQRTTPAGVFLEGDTPEGISDLAANSADWTSSHWFRDEVPEASAGDGDDASLGRRVICGASWTVVRFFADASRKQRGELDWRNSGIGFRVVCASPSGDS